MLNPYSRHTYLEELRPPEGCVLDRAIATTFSLDLLTLLMAPLSMVIFEANDQAAALKDQIAVIEALRQTAGKLSIFCQEGRIAVPKNDNLLYGYLEPTVIEVNPPGEGGVFHPKVWVLRFIHKETKEIYYRFICLSRNLTFDRSWDTTLALDGVLAERTNAFARNRPLADFISRLPDLAVRTVKDGVKENIKLISEELLRVKFEAPEEFEDDLQFIPLGIEGYKRKPKFDHADRLFIMSPFLSEGYLKHLPDTGGSNVLISRPESLDELSDPTYDSLKNRYDIYIMNDRAEKPENDDPGLKADAPGALEDASGLHAKMYLAEEGWYARLLTGSANATTPAFDGKNVEFLVELKGRRSIFGINQLLNEDDKRASFFSMLRKYQRPQNPPDQDPVKKRQEESLEKARDLIIKACLSVSVEARGDKLFDVTIGSKTPLKLSKDITEKFVYPITLKNSFRKDMSCLEGEQGLVFPATSVTSLTGFYAFQLVAVDGNTKTQLSFVLNLPVLGIPEERDRMILTSILSDPNSFIRYLLFLLAEDPAVFQPGDLLQRMANPKGNFSAGYDAAWPLFEEMVKAFSRSPEKMSRIRSLVDEITKSEEGKKLLPEGFGAMWGVFLKAWDRQESSAL